MTYSVSRKKDQNVFVISSIKLGRFWWTLVHRFPDIFASKWCRPKRFSPYLNNVSTLPCETWNAHRTRVLPLSRKYKVVERNSRIWPPNSPDLNPVDYIVWGLGLLQENVYKTRVTDWEQSGAISRKAGLCRHCGSYASVASLTAPEQWCVFYTLSLATFPTCCYQLDSNLANLETQLTWDKFWSFFL